MMNLVTLSRRSSPGVKQPLSLACLFAACLLAACSSGTLEPDPEPQQNVACGDLQTGLEGGVVPPTLSATGLFQDIRARTLAPNVRKFEPAFTLWSDNAEKTRYVQIPDGCPIETSDMDHWVLPVGARLWKDFVVDGKLLETRFIARYGTRPKDFILAAYAWREDGSDADYVQYGVVNAQGSTHNIPAAKSCTSCHNYLPERALGFSALQLNHDGAGVTLKTLVAEGRLSTAVPALKVPGDAVASKALGYLHANCGNCHNPQGIEFNNPFTLQLSVTDTSVEDTGTWKTGVRVPVEKFVTPGVTMRISPGNPEGSCIVHRMTIRGTTEQMPPIASKIADDDGLSAIQAWVKTLQ
ncbi:hypothetical protein [Hyalangium sp.]|uniref:hypothetical protein n=1 Tax=Hyalangium sp. TaxID=2028555 RepID=UPI002D33C279|nr:hypothetical protein [Hyalangium sp.]HYH97064.1 hypothetical protein [Hyalangium sp.]